MQKSFFEFQLIQNLNMNIHHHLNIRVQKQQVPDIAIQKLSLQRSLENCLAEVLYFGRILLQYLMGLKSLIFSSGMSDHKFLLLEISWSQYKSEAPPDELSSKMPNF